MDISLSLRSLRKSIAGLSMLALLATMSFAGIANAQTFSDTAEDDWWYEAVEALVAQGIVADDVDTYRPGDTLNRAEAIKLVVEAFAEVGDYGVADYDDVDADAWYYPYVDTGTALGIVSGYGDSNNFGPGDNVTRSAFAKMVVNGAALEEDLTNAPHFNDAAEGNWFYTYVETGYNNSIFDGYDDGSFGVGGDINRAEAAVMVDNGQNPTLRYTEGTEGDECADGYDWDTDTGACVATEECSTGYEWDADSASCVESEAPASDATLTVEMGDSLSGVTVPKGATAVEVLNLEFTAEGDDAELDGFTLHRTGVGSVNDISYIYIYNGDERLTSGRTFSSSTNEVVFGSLNLAVEDGETVTLTLVVDFASGATTGDENAVELTSSDKVDTNAAEVTGTFGIVGETFTISGASAGTVTIAKTGSTPNPTLGDTDAEIAEFQLTSSSSEDSVLTRIALTIKGTAPANTYSNLQLLQSGEVLATADAVSEDDIVTFVVDGTYSCDDYGYTGDGFCIGKGNSKTFTVTADLGAVADPSDTSKTYLDESTDLTVMGLVYGFGQQITYSAYDNSAADGTDATWTTFQGGQFTISQDTLSSTDVTINGKDVILNKMTFRTERDIEVKNMDVVVVGTGSGLIDDDNASANFSDFKLVRLDDDGEIVETLMGPVELSTSGGDSQTLAWTTSWTMDAGDSMDVAITCDIDNDSTLNASTLTASLGAIDTADGIRDLDTNEYITDIVPSVAITGQTMTVKAASLAVALASSADSDTYVKGTSDVELAIFTLTVGSSMDAEVDQVVIAGYIEEDGVVASASDYTQGVDNSVYVRNVITSAYITDQAGNLLGTSESFSTGGDATFDSLNWTITAGTTEVMYLYGDISGSAPYNGTDELLYFDIDDVSADMTVTDTEGNTITATGDAANNGSMAITVSAGGTLAISEDSSNVPDNQIVAGGDEDVLVGRFKLSAADETFSVNTLTLTATGLVNGTADATAGVYLDNIDSVTLKYASDTAALGTLDAEYSVAIGGTNAVFSGFGAGDVSELVVPKDQTAYVEVYADFTNHNLEGGSADSDDAVLFVLNTGDADGEANGDFEAVGQGSGTAYVESELSDVSLTNYTYVYRTVPTVANATSLGSSLIAGADQEVYRFTVSASDTEQLALMYLTLKVSPTGLVTGNTANSLTNATDDDTTYSTGVCATGSGLTLSSSVSTAPWYITEYGKSTKVGSGCYDSLNGHAKFAMNIATSGTAKNSGTQISAGSSKTFSVYADVYEDADTSTTGAISIKISEDTSYLAAYTFNSVTTGVDNNPYAETSGTATGLIWTDYGAATGTHGEETTEYMTGYKVPGMPVSYMTLSK